MTRNQSMMMSQLDQSPLTNYSVGGFIDSQATFNVSTLSQMQSRPLAFFVSTTKITPIRILKCIVIALKDKIVMLCSFAIKVRLKKMMMVLLVQLPKYSFVLLSSSYRSSLAPQQWFNHEYRGNALALRKVEKNIDLEKGESE